MRDVDFLPQWYKDRRRQRSIVQKQYLALSVLFLSMMVWNAFAVRSIRSASAALSLAEQQRIRSERVSAVFDQLSTRADELQRMTSTLAALERSWTPAKVWTLLSGFMGTDIQWHGVQFAYGDAEQRQVVLSGTAPDAGRVATLIQRLEASKAFTQVNLIFCREASVDSEPTAPPSRGSGMSEFELTCHLAEAGPKIE